MSSRSSAAERARVALVTGAASGIGRAVVERLITEHLRVVAVDVTETGPPVHPDVESVVCDITSSADRRELIGHAERLDYLVNAAGIIRLSRIEEATEADWDDVMDVNAKAVFFLTQAAAEVMAPGGAIVNVSSTGGKTGATTEAAIYNASKAAVITMTKSFCRAYAARGLRVNAVCPTFTDTPMLDNVIRSLAEARGVSHDDVLSDFHRVIPLRRMAAPSEIANTVWYLLSDEASYITGQAISVSGGW